MRRVFAVTVVMWGCLFASSALGTSTEISYEASYLGQGQESGERWQYTYDVTNKSNSTIDYVKEFTIWFDYGKYDNLTLVLPAPAGWDPIKWDPEPVLQDNGAYDAKASAGIGKGGNVYGFAVSFDWLGTGTPGPQQYHIVDPDNYPVPIEMGWTPEPATLCLLGLGGFALLRKRR